MRFLPLWVSFRSASTQVDTRTKLVDRTGATMEEVVSSIRRVSDIMGENMTATQEQSGGIEQVNQAIDHMDEATQRNAALVEESVAALGKPAARVKPAGEAVAL
ncbi:methyl-accepting chemotaxis protein [Massilia sp. S19_KUP03_FR1]|uniref:methyl-accepting chemotaxis protein n=1 Tax=Massilia sp. S19_KUP03_FR1 TaxID=3025503 RepID=UPI002FCD8BDF